MKELEMLTVAAFLASLSLMADTATVGDYTWQYSLDGVHAVITGVSPSTGDVSIPESFASAGQEHAVVGIAESAFAGSAGLIGVEIPYSVTNVAARAFANCPALSCVTVLNPSARIAEDAFSNCTAIAAAVLPASLTGSAATLFPDSSAVSVYRADRIDRGAEAAVLRTLKLSGFKATSTPGVCKATFDTTLASGVDATIDPSPFKVVRAATLDALSALPDSSASQNAIAGDVAARDMLAVTLRVTVDPSTDGDIHVTYDEDEIPETESPDKRHFKIVVED